MHLAPSPTTYLKDWDLETLIKNLEAPASRRRTAHAAQARRRALALRRRAGAGTRTVSSSKVRLLSYGIHVRVSLARRRGARARTSRKAKRWIDLAHDTGAWGVKVRPNGLPEGVPRETTISRIGECLRELGEYGAGRGVEIWMEVHGRGTQDPPVSAAIMKAAKHDNVGVCWNSNPTDIVNGSIKPASTCSAPGSRTSTSTNSPIRLSVARAVSRCSGRSSTTDTPSAKRRRARSPSVSFAGTARCGAS